jgi:hypothetical protein
MLDGTIRPDGALPDGTLPDGAPRDGGSADAQADGGGGTGCPLGELRCQGECTDPETDRTNCGRCGNVCGPGELCRAGDCAVSCDFLSECGDQCVDLSTDANNCGQCGRNCESGICRDSMCVDPEAGHVVVIGHDYRNSREGMNRLAGNSVFLARGNPVRTLVYEGDARNGSIQGIDRAINQLADSTGRSWQRMPVTASEVPFRLEEADALVVYPQHGSDDATLQMLGTEWSNSMMDFLDRGGVIVLFEGTGDHEGTHQILESAGMFTAGPRAAVSGDELMVQQPGDAVALGVPLTYRGETSTVRFESADPSIVVSHPEGPVVVHRVFLP